MSAASAHVQRFLASLEDAGCNPRLVGPGEWVALCPTCKLAGHDSLVEIREPGIVCCVSAHEPPQAEAA
jgi:hypothetical protein